jgi:hypothetical protein
MGAWQAVGVAAEVQVGGEEPLQVLLLVVLVGCLHLVLF